MWIFFLEGGIISGFRIIILCVLQVVPKVPLLRILQAAGAQGDTFTLKEVGAQTGVFMGFLSGNWDLIPCVYTLTWEMFPFYLKGHFGVLFGTFSGRFRVTLGTLWGWFRVTS